MGHANFGNSSRMLGPDDYYLPSRPRSITASDAPPLPGLLRQQQPRSSLGPVASSNVTPPNSLRQLAKSIMQPADQSIVSTTIDGVSFTASASLPQSNLSERVYQVIDDLCMNASGPVWLSQKELAVALRVTPRTINRVISRLKGAGRLTVSKTGPNLCYLTHQEPRQLAMVAAITSKRSSRTSSRDSNPESPPVQATVDGPLIDDPTTPDSQPIDTQWSTDGQLIDSRWTAHGRLIDDPTTLDSQPMDTQWSTDGPAMVITEGSEPADVWEKVLAKIATQLPPTSFLEFLQPTVGLEFDDTSFTVATRNSHAVMWLQRPLHLDIAQSALRTIDGSERKIIYQENLSACKNRLDPSGHAKPELPAEPPEVTPCPQCTNGTMTLTTWQSLRKLPGMTYYCRGSGACSRLWNSEVGEFHPAGETQLNPEEARNLLSQALRNRPRSYT